VEAEGTTLTTRSEPYHEAAIHAESGCRNVLNDVDTPFVVFYRFAVSVPVCLYDRKGMVSIKNHFHDGLFQRRFMVGMNVGNCRRS
jgi:hypothetical protein